MRDFLTEAWLRALGDRLATVAVPAGIDPVAVGQRVTDVPHAGGGTVDYTISFDGASPPRLEVGSTQEADVVLVTSFADAAALAAGEATAGALLEGGRIKIRGDASRLVRAAALLEATAAAAANP